MTGNDNGNGPDDLERLLNAAFDAKARAAVPEHRVPPPMRLPDHLSPRRHRSNDRSRLLAPLAAAAAVLVAVAVVLGLTRGGSDRQVAVGSPTGIGTALPSGSAPLGSSSGAPSSASSSATSSATSSSPAPAAGKPVTVSSAVISDGSSVGVGMPIIVLLSRPIRDAHAFAAATRVTVNGKPVSGGWYFERKYSDAGHPIEADYRLQDYWPAHARIHLSLPVKGLSAGRGLVFHNDLSLDFSTGAANVVTVDDSTHTLSVEHDGKLWGTFPVSLGASATPTKRGVKVIMEKGASICMRGPGYSECGVKYTQRLTYDGEYLHAAPWNVANISAGVDSSNGCTNLSTADAKRLYDLLQVGDVVNFPNADGPAMQLGDGYGDWNVPWTQWRTGGLYPVR